MYAPAPFHLPLPLLRTSREVGSKNSPSRNPSTRTSVEHHWLCSKNVRFWHGLLLHPIATDARFREAGSSPLGGPPLTKLHPVLTRCEKTAVSKLLNHHIGGTPFSKYRKGSFLDRLIPLCMLPAMRISQKLGLLHTVFSETLNSESAKVVFPLTYLPLYRGSLYRSSNMFPMETHSAA